jgi:hypothetical protein
MKKNGNYLGKYLKSNALVLLCELAVVLLLGFICSFIVDADPLWLAPVLAFVAYLMAELRFMMAYVATNVRRDREADPAPAQDAYDEMLNEALAEQPEEQTAAPAMPYVAPAEDAAEQAAAEQTAEQAAEQTVEQTVYEETTEAASPLQQSIDMDDEDEAVDALFAEYMSKQTETSETSEPIAVPVADVAAMETAPAASEAESPEFELTADPTLAVELTSEVAPEAVPAVELEAAAAPAPMESLELVDEEDFTMDDEPSGNAPTVARDVLDIGEIDA